MPSARRYRVEAVSLGQPTAGADLTRALNLAGALEDEEIARKLEERR